MGPTKLRVCVCVCVWVGGCDDEFLAAFLRLEGLLHALGRVWVHLHEPNAACRAGRLASEFGGSEPRLFRQKHSSEPASPGPFGSSLS